jgi:hypothetical protein
MYTSQKRFGRHLVTKSVTERDFATRRQDIDESEKLTMQRLKLEKIKVWEDLRRINVRSRSLKRGSLIEREILAERKKLEKKLQDQQQRPLSSVAIHNHLSGSLVITGVQPLPRPVFRDEDGRPIRPRTTATPRVALSVRQIDELRPKTAGAIVASARSMTPRDSKDLLPAAMNRKLLKAERLADSLDNLHIRHYLSPEELKAVDGDNQHNQYKSSQPYSRHQRHLLRSGSVKISSDDSLQVADELSIVLDAESVQPKRLLQRERSANKLRRKSLSMDDISQLQKTNGENGPGGETGCDRLATKGFITKPVSNQTFVKLPSAEPEEDHEEVETSEYCS